VTLVASLGPPLTEVPALVDKKLERAKQLLETARLKVGGIRRRWSFEVPAGKVIAAKPARGRLPEGSPVSMVVSRGAKPQVVPGVVGMKADAAETALTGRGFVVTRSDDFSDEIPEGRVIAVTPAEGTTQPYGSAASIVVSLGPERFPCPDFRGKSKNDAKALAEQRHLEVTFLQVPGTNGTTVFSQLPLPGVTVRYGQTITLYLA
jgi:serine/threonine-protein kinase